MIDISRPLYSNVGIIAGNRPQPLPSKFLTALYISFKAR
jgi:hypothetical protein